MPNIERDNLLATLADFVQEHMPWPFNDVDRDSDEANDIAWLVARELMPHFDREFADIGNGLRTRRSRR